MVEMQVGVDDAGDVARDVLGVCRGGSNRRSRASSRSSRCRRARPAPSVDRPDEHAPALALDEELRREMGADQCGRYHRGRLGALRWRVRPGRRRLRKRIRNLAREAVQAAGLGGVEEARSRISCPASSECIPRRRPSRRFAGRRLGQRGGVGVHDQALDSRAGMRSPGSSTRTTASSGVAGAWAFIRMTPASRR